MGLRIATNVQSLNAQRTLAGNYRSQNASLEKLASGARINRAGDDAAGLAISEKLRASIRSLKQDSRNANDGISLIQVAEGAMNEVGNILIRLRELSIQTASDTIGDTERGFVDKETQHLKAEIDRIANTTQYNGQMLLNGQSPVLEFQVGLNNDPNLDRLSFDSQALQVGLEQFAIADVSNSTKEASQNNLAKIDAAINRLNDNRSGLGALQNRLQSTINNITIYKENIEAANSRIRDTDVAEETSELVKANILTQSNIAVLSQANTNSQMALKLLS